MTVTQHIAVIKGGSYQLVVLGLCHDSIMDLAKLALIYTHFPTVTSNLTLGSETHLKF
jgi:hypothetical protein